MATPLPIPFSFLTRGATASVFIRRCSSTITLSRSHLHSKFASRETALKSSAISRPITGRHPRQSRLVSSSKPNNTFKTAAKVESSALDSGEHASQASMTMWQRFLAPKPMPERHTATWYREMLLICTVFGITGSSTMLVRCWVGLTAASP